MVQIGYKTISGIKYRYSYKTSWSKRYYSFDGERSWHTSRVEAIRVAQESGLLCRDNQFYRKYSDGKIEVVTQ